MEGKRMVHIGAEVDSDLWNEFREQAFAENLTTGQLLDKLIAAYLEMIQNYPQQSTVRAPEDIVLEQEQQQDSLVEEGQEQDLYEETVQESDLTHEGTAEQEPDETLKPGRKSRFWGKRRR
jgi:hypothetical protein